MADQYELNHLRFELQRANEKIGELEQSLWREQDRHRVTTLERDDLKKSRERAYDSYVTDPHEGYIRCEEVATNFQLLEDFVAVAERLGNLLREWDDAFAQLNEVYERYRKS